MHANNVPVHDAYSYYSPLGLVFSTKVGQEYMLIEHIRLNIEQIQLHYFRRYSPEYLYIFLPFQVVILLTELSR